MSKATGCSICLEDIKAGQGKVLTDCGHEYHSRCLFNNISLNTGPNRTRCPLCRAQICENPKPDKRIADEFEQALTGRRETHVINQRLVEINTRDTVLIRRAKALLDKRAAEIKNLSGQLLAVKTRLRLSLGNSEKQMRDLSTTPVQKNPTNRRKFAIIKIQKWCRDNMSCHKEKRIAEVKKHRDDWRMYKSFLEIIS